MISVEKKISVLDQAYSLLQFRAQENTEQSGNVLAARSRLSAESEFIIDRPEPPELGHASARIAFGGGRQTHGKNEQSFVDLKMRMAFHDLIDSPLGYTKGSAINVMDTHLRWLPDEDILQLERLDLFNVVSLNSVSDWYVPLSWQLDVRLQRMQLSPVESDLAFIAEAGGGYSKRLANTTLFAMAMIEADASDNYKEDYSLLAGGQVGVSVLFGVGQMLLLAENRNAMSGFEIDKDSISAELQFNPGKDLGLRLGYEKNKYRLPDKPHWHDEEWFLRLQQYF